MIVKLIYYSSYTSIMGKIMLSGYKCERCKHTWIPRDKRKPLVCPKCKSPYWDRKKRR